uniref:Uncharacterized protein n=1 Tax=Sphaerodactylus townsendi TaxID=933632 RepID=A0ACB8ER25_9SAUR
MLGRFFLEHGLKHCQSQSFWIPKLTPRSTSSMAGLKGTLTTSDSVSDTNDGAPLPNQTGAGAQPPLFMEMVTPVWEHGLGTLTGAYGWKRLVHSPDSKIPGWRVAHGDGAANANSPPCDQWELWQFDRGLLQETTR